MSLTVCPCLCSDGSRVVSRQYDVAPQQDPAGGSRAGGQDGPGAESAGQRLPADRLDHRRGAVQLLRGPRGREQHVDRITEEREFFLIGGGARTARDGGEGGLSHYLPLGCCQHRRSAEKCCRPSPRMRSKENHRRPNCRILSNRWSPTRKTTNRCCSSSEPSTTLFPT